MRTSGKIGLILIALITCLITAKAQQHWTLKECIDTAIVNSITVQLDITTVELNRLGVKQSKNNLLPSINGSLEEALSVGRMVNPITGVYEAGNVWSTGPGISVTQNLFDGLQYLNTIKQSELIHQSSKFDLEDARFNLTVSVVNAFLQVLYANEAIKIAQQQVEYDSSELQITSDLLYVGKKVESDLLQIESQLRTDQYTVVNDQSQWRVARVNLQQMMNLPVTEGFDIDYSVEVEPEVKPSEDINNIYVQSLAWQPIIKSYALKTQSAEYAIKVAKGAYYPQLLFKAGISSDYSSYAKQTNTTITDELENIGYLQGNPSDVVMGKVPVSNTTVSNYPFSNQMSDNLNGTFAIGLSIPILNYLQVRNNVKKQVVNLKVAKLNEQNTKLTLRKTIEQVYTNVENSQAQYVSSSKEVEASKAAYDVSVTMFEQGKEIITDLLVQKNAYIKALSDYLQAKYGLLFNSKILDYYKGVPVTF